MKSLEDPYMLASTILPFLEKQKDIVSCRLVNQSWKQAVSIFSKTKDNALSLKRIHQYNIEKFLEWLKEYGKTIDFHVGIKLTHTPSIEKTIHKNQIKIIFELLDDKIKKLYTFLLDLNFFPLKKLKKSSVIHLKLDCDGIELLKNYLPKNLETLIIKGSQTEIKDEDLQNLPTKLKVLNLRGATRVTGEFFTSLPDSVEDITLSVCFQDKFLKNLSKKPNIKKIDIKSTFFKGNFVKDLPKNLLELISGNMINSKDLKFLPKKLIFLDIASLPLLFKLNQQTLKNLPKNLKILKIWTLEHFDEKDLDFLPKTLSKILLCDDSDYIKNKQNQKNIQKLRNKKIRVKTFDGEEYPKKCVPDHKHLPSDLKFLF